MSVARKAVLQCAVVGTAAEHVVGRAVAQGYCGYAVAAAHLKEQVQQACVRRAAAKVCLEDAVDAALQ